MPVTLESMLANLKRVEVVVATADGEEVLKVAYRPATITPRFRQVIASADPNDSDREVTVEMLVALLSDWDLTSNGKPYPITHEALMALPYPFLIAVATAVMSDVNSDPPTPASKRGS